MKEFISIQEALNKGKGEVSVRGWAHRERGSNKLKFIVLRDSSNIIQCVIKPENKFWDEAQKVTVESSVEITGTLKADERAPTGFELQVTDLKLIGSSDSFPISRDVSPEFLLDVRHLYLRSRKLTAVMKVRHTVLQAFRDYFLKEGYFEFTPPVLQPTQSEGGSTLFEVKYYKEKMYLAQTWQLYGEASIFSLEKTFCLSPTFRAEKSKTSRHLSEFIMAEMEAAWMDLPGLADHAENLLRFIIQRVLKERKEDLKILERDVETLKKADAPFKRMTYSEVLELLEKKDGMKVKWGKDLRTVEEDNLSKHFDTPVIVTHYPEDIMAFYKPPSGDGKTSLCMDVIAPEGYGEIIGGSQRDLDIERMSDKLKKEGEDPKDYQFYWDLRNYGSVPHSGFGLGVERVVAWMCGIDNVKDAIGFPRTMTRFKP
ncbi:asparagine--tRNA ligase [Candidatus Woesearchaeota archaeon]|nr:asparagine--tRNA ligase [Candidatus Woesearchaeota archaeon]MBT5215905.1 asparagine--tRNA ligase [Candidatus Woesearchaeota archaeon]